MHYWSFVRLIRSSFVLRGDLSVAGRYAFVTPESFTEH